MDELEPRLEVPVTDEDHVLGRFDAPLTLLEYGDFECKYCRAAYPVVEQVREQLGDRLRFVFRHFPLEQLHPHALMAAEAAEAANSQGAFWHMFRLLYTRRAAVELRDPEGLAEELGIDARRFISGVSAHRFLPLIRDHVEGGLESGVTATPTFFVNGELFTGDWRGDGLLRALLGDEAEGVEAP